MKKSKSSDDRPNYSRRRFLRASQATVAALGAAPMLGSAKNVFASAVPSASAEVHPVHLRDLQEKAGAYIARKLRTEGCCISCGASSAITLATAASVMAANNCNPLDIPTLIGTPQLPKNEVVVQKIHRYEYDVAMQICGIKIVDVVTLDDYKQALGPNTVMTNYFNAADDMGISREDWIAAAHEKGVPCHLDAAADMPPISNLWKYTGMGFDMVSFSGGKDIRGPQNT